MTSLLSRSISLHGSSSARDLSTPSLRKSWEKSATTISGSPSARWQRNFQRSRACPSESKEKEAGWNVRIELISAHRRLAVESGIRRRKAGGMKGRPWGGRRACRACRKKPEEGNRRSGGSPSPPENGGWDLAPGQKPGHNRLPAKLRFQGVGGGGGGWWRRR